MKKIIKSVSIVLALAIFLCGCNTNSNEISNQESKPKNTYKYDEIETTNSNGLVFSTVKGSYETKKKQCLADLGKILDMKQYGVPYYSDTGFSLSLIEEVNFKLDKTIVFYDNSSIILPISYNDAKNCGWSVSESRESQEINGVEPVEGLAKYATSTGTYLTNSDGKTIDVSVSNTTTKSKLFKECDIYEVGIGPDNSTSFPKFKLTNGITEQSNYSDVIKIMGNPNEIRYSISDYGDMEEWIVLVYKNGSGFKSDSLEFQFSYTGELLEMNYSAGYEKSYTK